MSLSKEALKNLLDLMQKVSLATTAVSIGLLSSLMLSHASVEKEAQPELQKLLSIRSKIHDYYVDEIIFGEVPKALKNEGQESEDGELIERITVKGDPSLSCVVRLPLRSVCTRPIDPDLMRKRFNDIQTLQEMRKVWDAIASTKMFWKVGRIPNYVALFLWKQNKNRLTSVHVDWVDSHTNGTQAGEAPTPNGDKDKETSLLTGAVRLDLVDGEPPRIDAYRNEVSFEYTGVLPAFGSASTNSLMRAFHLDESERSLLENVRVHVDMDAKAYGISPALALDPALGQKANFAEAFPNLIKLKDEYQHENLESLLSLLEEAVAQQQSGELEVFGAKIPNELIALLGLPILAALLFHFSAVGFYVASNVEQINENESSEWSFLLKGWPFFAVSLGAILVLPSVASVLTVVFALGQNWWSKLMHLVLTIMAVASSSIAFWAIRRLRSRVRHSAEPAPTGHHAVDVDDLTK
jgi:hypothetical protein